MRGDLMGIGHGHAWKLFLLALAVLTCANVGAAQSGADEWISVAPSGTYFQTETGKPFIVIGENDAITWPYLNDLLTSGNPASTENYLWQLRSSGVNTMRIMFEYAQFQYGLVENPMGRMQPGVIAFWDRFVKLAEQYDMHLIITPWDPFWMQKEWASNPYNTANDGMMKSMNGFLTNPKAIEAQRRRWGWMIDRWGGSPAVMAWELMNEIELWWGATPSQISNWITQTADFIRQRELRLYGRTHLLTASLATPFPDEATARAVLAHPKLDFASTHQYTGPATKNPDNTVDAAKDVALATMYARSQIPKGRPYLDTESGPIDRWIADGDFDTEYYHNMSWAHLMSGGAGQGLRWPYRTPHVLSDGMHAVQAGMSRFVQATDWTGFEPYAIGKYITLCDGNGKSLAAIQPFGIADKRRILLWLLNMAPGNGDQVTTTSGAVLTVDREGWWRDTYDSPPGEAVKPVLTVEFWDTYAGTRIGTLRAENWAIPLPDFRKDLAVVIYMGERH